MSKQRVDMNVELRETGKGMSRALRNGKKIPAVVYGAIDNAGKNMNLTIDENFVKKYNTRAHENALFNLKSDNAKLGGVVVLMKSVTVHPLTRRPQHVDLFALDLKKTVRVSVEIRLEGKPLGIADGGLLNVVNRQIEIECLPTEIPESLTADISHLGVGDALHVSDVKIPPSLKLMSPADMTIAVVNLQEEEVVVAAPAADAAAAATPAAGAAAAPAAGDAKAAAGAKAPAADAKAAAKPAAKK